jgi:predicted ATPase
MLRRIRIHGYKSLDGVELELDDLTVVVGPNAAGKSNLLDAIHLLGRLATMQTLNEAFAEHRGTPVEAFTVRQGGLKTLITEQGSVEFTLSADVHLDDALVDAVETDISKMREGLPDSKRESSPQRKWISERDIRYEVTVEIRTDTGLLRVTNERAAALRADGYESQSRKPYLERVEHRLHLRMEGQAHPTYYDLGLDHTLLSRPLYAPHYPHLTALREEFRRWRVYYFDPEALRSESPLKQTTALTSRGGDLAAYMNTLQVKMPQRYLGLVQALKFIIPSVQGVEVGPTPEGLLSLAVVEAGVPFSARVVSEGTLRVLGMLAITDAASPSTFVAYEEPENGVHPRRLELIAELLRNAAAKKHVQLLVNTHSPILPALLSDARLYSCTKDADGVSRFRVLASGLFAGSEATAALAESDFQRRALAGEFGG